MISYKSFDQNKLENSIENIYKLATREEHSKGLAWYYIANEFAHSLAIKYDLTFPVAAGVIAALSPENSWAQNIIDAEQLIIQGNTFISSTYEHNQIKALSFISGKIDPVEHYIGNEKYNWRKAAKFFENIILPDELRNVTIDRHAGRVAHGYNMTGNDALPYYSTPRKYEFTANAYINLADKIGILPQQLQAITWLVYIRLYVDNKYTRIAKINL